MRKTLRNIALALAIMGTTTITTSCDSNTIAQLFPLISSLFNTGETYTFTGTAQSRLYTGSYRTDKWEEINGYEYELTTMLECANELGNLTIQAMSTQGISQISVTNLSLTPNSDQTYTVMAPTQNSEITGTLTIENVTYTAIDCKFKTAAATPNDMALEMTVYFQGSNESGDISKKLELVFTGKVATE